MPVRPPPVTPPSASDVSDRAPRALGVVYGSEGSPLATANTGRLQVDVITGGGGGGGTVAQGTAAAGSGAWPVELTEDTTNTIVKAGDAANKAVRVNLVAGGGAGGGAAQLQVYDGVTWQNVRDTAESATVKHVPMKIMGTGANPIEPLNSTPAGTEYALPTRPVALPLPTGAATDRATAAAPGSARLSDGAAFYDAAKTGQLPTALDGSGFLKTHEQGTAAISAVALPLPAGAATDVRQDTGNASLASLDTKTPALGAATIAASRPVNIASNQIVPVSVAALPLPSGAAQDVSLQVSQQFLQSMLAEMRRQTTLLAALLAATGNDVPDSDTIDARLTGGTPTWQQ